MSKLLKDFRDFVMRGNVLDLAVAVILGIAFNAVVNSLVDDVLMQIIAAIVGKPNFNDLTLIIAATLFVIIRVFENMQRRRSVDAEPEVLKTDEVVLLGEIRDILRERA